MNELPQPERAEQDLEALAAQLSASGDYRVLRRLRAVDLRPVREAQGAVKRALLVDVETTGLSYANDSIIELGVMLFSYDANNGQLLQILAAESWFQDPGRPIPPDVSRLTGITDDDVRGQSIDEARMSELAKDVGMIIAHNAAFDRPFIDRRLPFLADVHWGCSMNDVPWDAMKLPSRKLEFLLLTHAHTFLDTHHRALDDCRATLHVLMTPFADASLPMQHLRTNCAKARVRVSAVRSHFDTKDLLRSRGYKWSGDNGTPPRTWCKEIFQADLEEEAAWLQEHVYRVHPGVHVSEGVNLRKRYAAV
ncbi:MAG: 3'-5' exonuclease [Gemmatimonas sp.]